MAKTGQLKQAFDRVKRSFFPTWDRKSLWRVRAATFLAPSGRCETSRKVIFIREIPDCRDELDQLLIHEICHYNASTHGSKWCRNMEKAAQRAESIGRQKISQWIRSEIQSYQPQEAERVDATNIYATLEELIFEAQGAIPFKRLLVALAHDFQMSVKELEGHYKRLRRVYDKAKKELERKWARVALEKLNTTACP
jgi:predicted metal-dependent hydrolase